MTRNLVVVAMLPLLAAATHIPSTPDLGKAEGACRPDEAGPAFLVDIEGLKDRRGLLKVEVYPDNNHDFLADDNKLIEAGKTFRRVEKALPASGTPELCIRLPAPGSYSVMVLHDRDSNHKFGWRVDGIGFAGNPKLGWSKPSADKASAVAGPGLTRLEIVMNYQHGLGMRPLRKAD